ncbi:MAG TPA: hypothetical protein VHB97_16710 [Polyangia bacterium]|jgi:hypothetical protein|nr:hypothetical protein [Polyangia bacterium]
MRVVLLTTLALTGCHAATTTPPAAGGLTVHVAVAAAPTTGDVAIASVALHLAELHAVSDRSAVDPRAAASDVELALGDTTDLTLVSAPPGLYSAVDALLGSSADTGLDVQAVWHTARVHATLVSTPFDVGCATPVRLDPGQRARLDVMIDPAGWFAALDLASATSDPDDAGIVISPDDNRPLATALLANVMASFSLECAPE